MRWVERSSKVSGWTLLVLGPLSVLVGVIELVISLWQGSGDFVDSLILILFGLVAASLGAERLGPIEKLLDSAKTSGTLRTLDSGDEVYEEAMRMTSGCHDSCSIKATDLSPSETKLGSKWFKGYLNVLAGRISKGPVTYRLVYCAGPAGESAVDARRAKFDQLRAASRFMAKPRANPFPLEVMIVEDSVLFAFPVGNNTVIGSGIRINDQIFADRLGQWYDDFLFRA